MANPWDDLPDVEAPAAMPWDSLPDIETPAAATGAAMVDVPPFLRPANKQPKAPPLYAAAPSVPVAAAPVSNPWDELPDVELPDRTAGQWATDIGGNLGRGAYNLFDSFAGIGDIMTGGRVTPWLVEHGLDSKAARQVLENEMSPQARAQRDEVQNADGFVDTAKAMALNPGYTAGMALETLAPMVVGGVAGRGAALGARALGLGAGKAAAIGTGAGEGVLSAGQQAAQTVQQTGDLTPEQTALALGSGALTGAIGTGAGQLARRFGVTDLDAALAGQAAPPSGAGLLGRILGGFGSEGGEEVLQSAQEQVAQNLALGRPAMEGVSNAAAQGGVLGAMMGGAAGLRRNGISPAVVEPQQPQAQPAAAPAQAASAPQPASGLQVQIQAATGKHSIPVPFAGSVDIDPLLNNFGLDADQKVKAVELLRPSEASIEEARRGVLPLAEQQRLGEMLGINAKEIANGRKIGQAWNAETHIAVTNAVSDKLKGVLELQQAIAGGKATDMQKAQFVTDVADYTNMSRSLLGARAEAGRALAAHRRQVYDLNEAQRIIEGVGGINSADDLAAALGKAVQSGGLSNAAKLMANAKPGLMDYYYRAALLSRPTTHVVNAVSNLGMLGNSVIERGIAALISKAKGTVGLRNETLFHEPIDMLYGMATNLGTASQAALDAFKAGESPILGAPGVTDGQQVRPKGALEQTFSVPFRALASSDALFAQLNYAAELRALARNQAVSEKNRHLLPPGKKLSQRVDELVANPTSLMVERAGLHARDNTFNSKAGAIVMALNAAKTKMPWLNLLVPFARTPANILKSATRRTPLAPVLADVRADFAAGGKAQDQAIARVLWGTTFMVGAGLLAQAGVVIGSGPSDDKEKRALMATGWKPFSIKAGDTYYSYQRLDPWATLLGFAADIATMDYSKPNEELVGDALASFAANVTNKSFLQGLADFTEFMSDPRRNAEWYGRKMASTLVQPVSLLSGIASDNDPYMRESNSIWDAVKNRLPGLRETLQPQIDQYGRPVRNVESAGVKLLNPITQSAESSNPVRQALAQLKYAPPRVSDTFTIGKNEVKLNDAQHNEMEEIAGVQFYNLASKAVAKKSFTGADPDAQRDALDKLYAFARNSVKVAMAEYALTGNRSKLDALRANLNLGKRP